MWSFAVQEIDFDVIVDRFGASIANLQPPIHATGLVIVWYKTHCYLVICYHKKIRFSIARKWDN